MGMPSSIMVSLSCENTRWQSLPSMSGAGGSPGCSAILYVFPHPVSCLFCLLLTIPAPPSLAESRECCLVLLGLQAISLLKCWRSAEWVEGLTDIAGGAWSLGSP